MRAYAYQWKIAVLNRVQRVNLEPANMWRLAQIVINVMGPG